ncbi:hypothetical protein BGZ83_007254 [Gryganskiella cystojenkinii]|nr:hypothetical protein BGZ83_007254 [Gryganskiella cystojenkinii]
MNNNRNDNKNDHSQNRLIQLDNDIFSDEDGSPEALRNLELEYDLLSGPDDEEYQYMLQPKPSKTRDNDNDEISPGSPLPEVWATVHEDGRNDPEEQQQQQQEPVDDSPPSPFPTSQCTTPDYIPLRSQGQPATLPSGQTNLQESPEVTPRINGSDLENIIPLDQGGEDNDSTTACADISDQQTLSSPAFSTKSPIDARAEHQLSKMTRKSFKDTKEKTTNLGAKHLNIDIAGPGMVTVPVEKAKTTQNENGQHNA